MPLTTREFREDSPLSGVRRRYVSGAACAGVLVVLTVIALGGSGPDAPDTTAGIGTGAGTTTLTTSTSKGSLVPPVPVHRDPADPEWLTAAPQGMSWQRVDGVPLPFTASDGPTRIDGAVAAGYSHTPQGAVVAALQISMRILYSPDYARVLDAQAVLSAADRAKILTARAAQPRLDPAIVQASTVAPAGFKIGDYTGDAATVYYAYPRPSGSYRIARQAVVWRDGDWRYSSDLIAPALPEAPDLTGFTPL
ncbi:hypothetical protein DFR70_12613 [Nocardia tenerifensis]|uniref:DUF8175 domain-containing protein n=1 Tax=Nocardia tenerifensis TaxID=228006 RepID=A0A318JM75_9NOCA|nr:hypothetical protein [Nocardia tenerifensis]PXX53892.1 hypothetical protein DFR70_12613 [Nocardia tenerifensis]